MVKLTRSLVLVTAILSFGMTVRGGQVLQTPPGLSPGDTFRFVFITDGTTYADSSTIGDYNSFVNGDAGGATYNGSVVNWVAIGSTSSVSAINNVGQTATPVYLVDGTLVTTSTTSTGLWSGSLLDPIDEDITGTLHRNLVTWTGTNTNGSSSSHPLGDFLGVTYGVREHDRNVGALEGVAGALLSGAHVRNFAGPDRCPLRARRSLPCRIPDWST